MTIAKSLLHGGVEINGHPHRSHRSKKGRGGPIKDYGKVLLYKKKKQELKLKDLEDYEYK